MISFNTFLVIRKYILFSSQIFGVILCIYFILNTKQYEVSTSLFQSFFPNFYIKLNNLLANIGTYLLLIPLTIIILSLLIPESISLRICSSAFGIFSTSAYVASGLFYNTLTEKYNMKLFAINLIIPLDEKREIFKQEFARILEERYLKSQALYEHLKQQIIDSKFAVYDETLTTLKEKLKIKSYANEIIEQAANSYLHIDHKLTLDYVNLGVKIALGCLGVMALIFGAATIIRMLTESKTKEIADLAGGAASASLQGVLNNKEGLTVIQQAFDKIPEMAFTISQGIKEHTDENIKQAFINVGEQLAMEHSYLELLRASIQDLIKMHNKSATITADIAGRLTSVEENIANIINGKTK